MRSSIKYSLISVLIGLFSAACGQEFDTSPDDPGAFDSIEGELRGQQSSDEGAQTRQHSRRARPAEVEPVDDGASSTELVSCRQSPPARSAICINGFWSTGDRCHDDDNCREGSVCLAPREPHCFFEATSDEIELTDCPAGSTGPETPILCAPGYFQQQVTRDGCVTCLPEEDDCAAVERCRSAGLSFEQCVVEIVGSRARAARLIERAAAVDLGAVDVLEFLACGDTGEEEDDASARRRHTASSAR